MEWRTNPVWEKCFTSPWQPSNPTVIVFSLSSRPIRCGIVHHYSQGHALPGTGENQASMELLLIQFIRENRTHAPFIWLARKAGLGGQRGMQKVPLSYNRCLLLKMIGDHGLTHSESPSPDQSQIPVP